MIQYLVQHLDLQKVFLLAAIFVPLERLRALHPEQGILRPRWSLDALYLIANPLLIQLGLIAFVVLGLAAGPLVPAGVRDSVAGQPLWLQVSEVIVLADVGFYALHRATHRIPVLWRFHAVHHSIEHLDWLAAARVHPIDQILIKGVPLVVIVALGYTTAAIVIFGVIYWWQAHLQHANLRVRFGLLGRIVASPEFHHWHHANEREAYDTNFAGQLSFLDALFGTLYMPAGRSPVRYGIDDAVPRTYLGQLVHPLLPPRPAR